MKPFQEYAVVLLSPELAKDTGSVLEIEARFRRYGLTILQRKHLHLTEKLAKAYARIQSVWPFKRPDLNDLNSGPIIILIVKGSRAPLRARTICEDRPVLISQNPKKALKEAKVFFPDFKPEVNREGTLSSARQFP